MATSSSPPRDPESKVFAEEGQRFGSVHMSTLRPREKVKRRNSQNHDFPMKNLHFWKTTRRPQVATGPMWPQPGVVTFTTESADPKGPACGSPEGKSESVASDSVVKDTTPGCGHMRFYSPGASWWSSKSDAFS